MILGESNEVNKRVAQFQFTKDGQMGLLGTGGTTHGATPYVADRWYHIELRFDWSRKTVAFYVDRTLQQRQIPFRRESSSFIGACALGNRDRCTTWFDSFCFMREECLGTQTVTRLGSDGRATAWLGPLSHPERAARGFILRAEDEEGHVSGTVGPIYPLRATECAQRMAINASALADLTMLLTGDVGSSSDVVFEVEGFEVRICVQHLCIKKNSISPT